MPNLILIVKFFNHSNNYQGLGTGNCIFKYLKTIKEELYQILHPLSLLGFLIPFHFFGKNKK